MNIINQQGGTVNIVSPVLDEYLCDATEFGFDTPNLRSWHMGCPRTPPETFDRLRQMKADLDNAVEEEKQRMKQ